MARRVGCLWRGRRGGMLGLMLNVFVVHLDANRTDDAFLSDELLSETHAQIMTVDQAAALGFQGLPDDPHLRLVVVAPRDKGFVAGALERSAAVTGFGVHEVDM